MKIVKLKDGSHCSVIEDDSHISRWVEQHGRLDHDQHALSAILPHIPAGGVVIDCGAFIGDHTAAYAKAVGPEGEVFALEPNSIAYDCLVFNMAKYPWVTCINAGAGEMIERKGILRDRNSGASRLGDGSEVSVHPIDNYGFEGVGFIKMDCEGYEVKALKGARETIKNSRPTLVIEVNEGALVRQGTSTKELFSLLDSMGYKRSNIYPNLPMGGPQYDIICKPL